MSELEAEIAAVLRRSEACWDRQDYASLRALWDPEESEPFYLPEEMPAPLVGWDAIEGYWRNNLTILECIRVRYGAPRVRALAPDLALAMYDLRFDLKLVGERPPIGGENRALAIFRRRSASWLYCHYAEAPLSPILYVRRLYERDVTPEFAAFRAQQTAP